MAQLSTERVSRLIVFSSWDWAITNHDTLPLIPPPDDQHANHFPLQHFRDSHALHLKKNRLNWIWSPEIQGKRDEMERRAALAGRREPPIKLDIPRSSLDLGESWQEYWAYQLNIKNALTGISRQVPGLFRDYNLTAMQERAAHGVQFSSGWQAFARAYLSNSQDRPTIPYHIVSVAWSARFIEAALRGADTDEAIPMPSTICSNEVDDTTPYKLGKRALTLSADAQIYLQKNEATYPDCELICNGQDKVFFVRSIVQTQIQSGQLAPDPIAIYFGDGPSDLGCLIEARIGFLIGQREDTRQAILNACIGQYCLSATASALKERIKRQLDSNDVPLIIKVIDWNEAKMVMDIIVEML